MNFRIMYQATVGSNVVEGDVVVEAVDKDTALRKFLDSLGSTNVQISWCQPTSRPVGAVLEPGRERRAAMPNDRDPRTDRSSDGPKQPSPQGDPHKAPGGAGTGTRNDPAKEPAAQPGGGRDSSR